MGRPATGRTTKQVRVPKHLEQPIKDYIKASRYQSLEPLPHQASSYLLSCLLKDCKPSLPILKEYLKEWACRNVNHLGLTGAYQAIKKFYGAKIADCLINIPKPGMWWEVLGVHPDASPAEVKLAYKNMCRQWHPDLNSDPGATEVMCWVNKAWEDYSSSAEGSATVPGS
jgi:DnaJ domain